MLLTNLVAIDRLIEFHLEWSLQGDFQKTRKPMTEEREKLKDNNTWEERKELKEGNQVMMNRSIQSGRVGGQ